MLKMRFVVTVFITLLVVVPAYAGTLMIKFKSGKTQEIKLNDKFKNIDSIQYIESIQFTNSKNNKEDKKITPQDFDSDSVTKAKTDTSDEKEKGKSTGIRLKWATPRFGE